MLSIHLQAVSYWSKAVRASGNSAVELQAVIEKSVVLGLATNTASTSHSLADLMTTYASTLATQVCRIHDLHPTDVHPSQTGSCDSQLCPERVRLMAYGREWACCSAQAADDSLRAPAA